MSGTAGASDGTPFQWPHGVSPGIRIDPPPSGLNNQAAPSRPDLRVPAEQPPQQSAPVPAPPAPAISSNSPSSATPSQSPSQSPTPSATPVPAGAQAPSLTPIFIPPATPSPDPSSSSSISSTSSTHTAIYIPPPGATDAQATASATGPPLSSLRSGTLFAAIFVPIVVVALMAAGGLLCLARRRRRMRREGVRELKSLHQESVEHFASSPYSTRHSRVLPFYGPGLTSTAPGGEASLSTSRNNGPLITVDGPSYSWNRTAAPPPYMMNGAPRSRTSSGSRSPPHSRSGQLSEANLARHHRRVVPSPFAHPEDDLVSELSDPGEFRHPLPPRDSDASSIVSDLSDVVGRTATGHGRSF